MVTVIWCWFASLAGSRDAARPHSLTPGSVPPYVQFVAARAESACARRRRRWYITHRALAQRYAVARQEAANCRAALAEATDPVQREALRRAVERAEAAEAAAWQAGDQAAAALAQELRQVVGCHAAVIAAYRRGLTRRWPTGTPLPDLADPALPDTAKPWPLPIPPGTDAAPRPSMPRPDAAPSAPPPAGDEEVA